jgi:formylglycine-generating enzyme required for sulfatase activity
MQTGRNRLRPASRALIVAALLVASLLCWWLWRSSGAPDVEARGPAALKCVPKEKQTEAGVVFVHLCPGTFTMGSGFFDWQAFSDEKPAHQVTLSEFSIGKTEITNEQYRRFRPNHQGEANLPATNVTWSEAQRACEYFGGRLPTEAEWEYAARAGSQADWSFGDDEKRLGEYA